MRSSVAFLLLLASLSLAHAASVVCQLEPNSGFIGDTLRFEMRVQGAGGRPVQFPKPADPFAVLRADSSELAQGAFAYTLALYDTGHFTLKPLPVIVGKGAAAETLYTTPVNATIKSVLPDTATALLPLKPYRNHPFRLRDLLDWWWVGALIAAVAAGWYLRRYLRKRKVAVEELARPALPADEEAVRGLITLRDKKYPTRGMLKEFFIEYSHIMRRYLERRYGFPALEMTTFDLEYELEDGRYPKDLSGKLLPSLREADLVKFAKHVPDYRQCDSFVELGLELVSQTKPQPVADPAEEQAA